MSSNLKSKSLQNKTKRINILIPSNGFFNQSECLTESPNHVCEGHASLTDTEHANEFSICVLLGEKNFLVTLHFGLKKNEIKKKN